MNGKAWMAVVSVMAAIGATAPGCGSGNDPACPETTPRAGSDCDTAAKSCTYQDGPCELTFACNSDHQMTLKTSTCMPAAVDCWAAADGDTCALPGDSCGEQEDPCSSGFQNTCGDDHRWKTGGNSVAECCATRTTCPTTQPNDTEACNSCGGVVPCSFGCVQAVCTGDKWQVDFSGCPPMP
jgi:hypothetical protein